MAVVSSEAGQTIRHRLRLGEVFAGEASAWLFVGKSLFALYLAAWLAMWLHLERPDTAMITVGVVMHPRTGMVLAKSFYRAIGTLAGTLCGLALMCAFPQQRELLLLSLSLWLALCAGGAMLYRNFMSYGFVLAGYTAALVTLPTVNNPLHVFDSALMRVSEVMLGIVVAGVVSDLVFPERLRTVLRQSARAQFAQFIDLVRNSTSGAIARADIEQAHLRFVRAAVQLEDLRASVIFEDPEARARSTRIRLLNQHYMAASTSFQSLHHLINRLQRGGRDAVSAALIALYRPLGAALATAFSEQHDPTVLAPRLRECAAELPARAAALRAGLSEAMAQLEFDTGAVLLQRFTGELHEFTALATALRTRLPRGSLVRVHFRRGNDYAGAAITVLRTFLTMTTLSALWVMSGWEFGASAMILATIFSGLFAGSPNPLRSVVDFAAGYATGMLLAFCAVFWLLPGSEGFAMLVLATAPFLLIGPYLSTRTERPSMGSGYAIGFVSLLALKDPMVYDPVQFINLGIAQLGGVALTGAAFMIIPAVTGSGWQRARQLRRLREQVVLAATAPLEGLAWRFESVSRDLLLQVVTYARPGSDESRSQLAWALAVHESGRALIESRRALLRSALSPPVREAAQTAIRRVARLYQRPDAAHWQQADEAVRQAVAMCTRAGAAAQLLRLHLYQLHSVLHDDESPLAVYMPTSTEPAHAA